MSSFSKIIPMAMLAAIFVIGLPMMVATMGVMDEGVDLEGSEYEAQYDATTDTSIIGISVMQIIPILLGVLILIVAVVGLYKRR